jgi:PTS system fructose-specific IIC component
MAKIVAVTGCPTGVAHTYMAAEALRKTAAVMGHEIQVETQGAEGVKDPLPPAELEGLRADGGERHEVLAFRLNSS